MLNAPLLPNDLPKLRTKRMKKTMFTSGMSSRMIHHQGRPAISSFGQLPIPHAASL